MSPGRKSAAAGGTKTVGDLLPGLLQKIGVFGGLKSQQAAEAWAETAGPDVLDHARAVRLRGGTLIVEVDSSAGLQELRNFTGESQRRRVNEILGRPVVEKVVYKYSARKHGE